MTVKPSIYIIYIGVARLKLMFYIIFSRNKSCFVSFNKCPWRTSGQVWPRIISQFYDFLIYWTSWPCVQCRGMRDPLEVRLVKTNSLTMTWALVNISDSAKQIYCNIKNCSLPLQIEWQVQGERWGSHSLRLQRRRV